MDNGLVARLQTFTILNWYRKPEHVNPVQCARYGFLCDSRNRATCVQCGARLVCEPGMYCPYEILSTTHSKGCEYRSPVPEIWGRQFSLEEYLRRLGTLNVLVAYIPTINLVGFQTYDRAPLTELSTLQIYALFGWEADGETSIKCNLCNMRIRMTEATPEEDLNPSKSHRSFCPWIQGSVPGWKATSQFLSPDVSNPSPALA